MDESKDTRHEVKVPRRRLTPLHSEELRNQLIEGARNGVPMRVLLEGMGLNPSFLQEWFDAAQTGAWRRPGSVVAPESLVIIRDFCQRITAAYAECEAKMVERVQEASATKNLRTGIIEWRAAAWYLEHGPARRRWFRYQESDVYETRLPTPEEKTVGELSDSELIDLADPSWREILSLPAPRTEADENFTE